MKKDEKFNGWPKTENFEAVGEVPTLGHYFCIGPKHVAYAADHCGGTLDDRALAQHPCSICKKDYAAHEIAVAIYCRVEPKGDTPAHEELQNYLKQLVERGMSNGPTKYVGFVFVAGWKGAKG